MKTTVRKNGKRVKTSQQPTRANMIQSYGLNDINQLVARAQLAQHLGMSHGNDRDIYKTLGYPTTIEYEDYAVRYERQDMAAAVINRPVDATWTGRVVVTEVGDEEQLQNEWKQLEKSLKIKSKLRRLDKLSQIGEYAVLLLGFDDVKSNDQLSEPVASGKRQLRYVKPYPQDKAEILKYVTDASDPRYGLPAAYRLTIQTGGDTQNQVVVHHSRVLHVAGELLQSETEGVPALQRIYNRLMDLEIIVGGSAEMFWRGARPGYYTKADKEYEVGTGAKDDIKEQLTEYEHDLRRFILLEGMTLEELKQQLADPMNYVDVQLQMISAVTGIPKRILVGSERGELASTQDKTTWNSLIQTRREEIAEANIVNPFVERLMMHGVLTDTEEWVTEWEDLFAPSDKEIAEIGAVRSKAIKDYADGMSQDVLPLQAFFKFIVGLTDDEIEEVKELLEHQQRETEREEQVTEEEQRVLESETTQDGRVIPTPPVEESTRRVQDR